MNRAKAGILATNSFLCGLNLALGILSAVRGDGLVAAVMFLAVAGSAAIVWAHIYMAPR